jgi:demethylmenaquinone methyltransferase/2-methoxy-6-polyprenyl-1,4-benzoquinol methylase
MNQKSQTIRDMFSRIAPRYDLLNRTLSLRIDQGWRKKAVAYLPKKRDLKVLDLCAGTLDLTLAILKQNPDTEITALDFSEPMLRAGENKISTNFKKQVTLRVGDGMNLQMEEQSFDAVICGFGMRNIVDNPKALREIHHVLKPKGRIIILEFFKPTHLSAKLFHATYGKWILPKIGSWLSKDSEAYQYLFNSIQSYYSLDEFCELIGKKFGLIAQVPLTSHVASIVVGEKEAKSPSPWTGEGRGEGGLKCTL